MDDILKSVGVAVVATGAICYITYNVFKHIYIKKHVASILEENVKTMEVSTSRILMHIDGVDGKDILSLSWEELRSELNSGTLTATSVLRAYQGAAIDVQMKTNAVVSWVEGAEQQAKMLDSLPVGSRGPLHGIPVSVKECYDIAGSYSTAGMAKFARVVAEEDSPVVELVKKMGAVPFCKTNVPQAMCGLQCSNPIYGVSSNPHGSDRECGGSSGGEGALIGGGGSLLGIGNDIGGSLRNPAAFCGCYTLKPTVGRHLSLIGVQESGPVIPGIPAAGGFMAQSAAAVEAAWRLVWDMSRETNPQKIDTSVLPMKWNQEIYEKKPRLGYFLSDGLIDPAPGCTRAVTEAVDILSKAGFKSVTVPPPDIHKMMYYFNGIVLADCNDTLYKNMNYDVYDSSLKGLVTGMTIYKLPWIIKKFVINPIHGLFSKIPLIEKIFTKSSELADEVYARDEFVMNYLAEMDNYEVDVILCPGQMLPAPPTGILGTFPTAGITYIPWNVMNFPAGIAPITKWNLADDVNMSNYPSDDQAYKMIKKYCKEAQGLPLAVQVVARPFMDEQVLRILSELEKLS